MILNCVERRSALGVADIERIVEMPVRYMVPAGPGEIARAVQKGVAVEGSSPLAKQLAKIAVEMVSLEPVVKKTNPVRRFVEYFSIGMAGDGRRD
jgi:Flp pilus assembly CpaE family ATPase